ANDCVPRSLGPDRIVCVCNATYCDGLPENHSEVPTDGSSNWYISNKEGFRLKRATVEFQNYKENPACNITIVVNSTKKYQQILGFGGAFTDSTGINIKKLSPGAQENLMRTYYDPKTGSGYTLGRIPIGGTDFSTRPYTYDDTSNDTSLEHFALAPEDYQYKIPFVKKALELNPSVKLFSAAWSAPAWMKTDNKLNGFGGFLKKQYYQLYCDYLLKFLDAYKKYGLKIWAVSTGNEPADALVPFDPLNNMGWSPESMAIFIADYLGPTLAKSDHKDTIILALDDQRIYIPWYIYLVFLNEKAREYTAGADKFLLMTEACIGSQSLIKVDPGSWERGEIYMLSIIEYMNNWYVGWNDWNLALDLKGGPTWIGNNVDSPILVNADTDEFYKQPMYYALNHVSGFVDTGSYRVDIGGTTDSIHGVAFVAPSNKTTIVLYNKYVGFITWRCLYYSIPLISLAIKISSFITEIRLHIKCF
ncbi:Glucosylceramidase, partial [Dufourea novaeangliae]